MKKFLSILLSFIIIIGIISGTTFATNSTGDITEPGNVISVDSLKIGDYFTLGKYNDVPIVWRYVADDEHGKLIVSDKILALKAFGDSNFWAGSYLRKWLNSTAEEGEADWGMNDTFVRFNKDDMNLNEKGFLNENNFSKIEKSVMKTITQWTMLPGDHLDLATNGKDKPYSALKAYHMQSADPKIAVYYGYSEFPDSYTGSAYEVTDTVFLLDEMQIYSVWKNLSDLVALCADGVAVYRSDLSGKSYYYFLRTPNTFNNSNNFINDCTFITGNGTYGDESPYLTKGVRPAFYLDTDNAIILSGSGTLDDPYVIDGKTPSEVVSTDITAEIGGNPIPSYNIDGNTAISAEDLSDYGFDVTYDDATRTLKVNRSEEKAIALIDSADERFVKSGTVGKKLYDIYRSNIKVYIDGKQVNSFNINGRSLIYIDDLAKYGDVVWDGDRRMISVKYRGK